MPNGLDWRDAVAIFAVVCSGLISGQMVAIALANYADRGQPEASWTQRFQLENALFTKTMPFALMVPLLALVAFCVIASDGSRPWFIAAGVMLAIVLVITMAANVPINKQVGGWQPGAAPAPWQDIRDRWLRFHCLRTVIGVLSLTCAAIALKLL